MHDEAGLGGVKERCAEDAIAVLQDLKCFVFALIGAHFKIQPIQK